MNLRSVLKIPLQRWILKKRFLNTDIAAHSLRPGGKIAGSIDDYRDRRLTGWIYDATRPNTPSKIRLLVDGRPVEEFLANIYRSDIAKIANNNGLNGFEIDPSKYFTSNKNILALKLELAASKRYYLGPVIVFAGIGDLSRRKNHYTSLPFETVDEQIAYIFSYVKAALEDSRHRLECLQSTVETLRTTTRRNQSAGLSPGSQLNPSTISGVGDFSTNEMDQAAEQDFMMQRLDSAVLEARLSS